MPPYAIPDPTGQRTWPTSDSYIKFADEPEPWAWFFPETRSSFVVWAEPQRPLSRADVYAALLQADGYLEASRDALRAGADDAVRNALEVLRGLVAVVIGHLGGSPSESLGILH